MKLAKQQIKDYKIEHVKRFLLFLLLLIPLSAYTTEIKATSIIATIKPLHSLVAGVIGDTGEAKLLVTGKTSPHNFQLKPSQMKDMQEADIIFYIDDSFEIFLTRIFEVLPSHVIKVPVAREAGLTFLSYRKGKTWESHKHDAHDHDAHDHHDEHDVHDHHDGHDAHNHHDEDEHDEHHRIDDYDMHVWLDPENAKKIVLLITEQLIAVYPEHQAAYRANAQALTKKIDTLNTELRAQLLPVRGNPFVVFHDAYQYFEHAYGLNGVGSITFEGSEALSPTRIKAIREKLRQTNATCIFREPQFPDRAVETIGENFDVKFGTLDPLGAQLPADEHLYFKLLKSLAHNLTQCLTSK